MENPSVIPESPQARIELAKSIKHLIELKKSDNPYAGRSRNPINFDAFFIKNCNFCGKEFSIKTAKRIECCSKECATIMADITNRACDKEAPKLNPQRRIEGFRLYARISKASREYVCGNCGEIIPVGEKYANQKTGKRGSRVHLACYEQILAKAKLKER